MDVTREERRNGWDGYSLDAYRAERDGATPFVGGNVVTEWTRPRQLPRIENTLQHNPHRYWR